MIKILVLYYSKNGSTEKLAEQIARGVHKIPNCEAKLRTVMPIKENLNNNLPDIPDKGAPFATLKDFANCDGLILGSPTRFGNMSAELKYFLDGTGSEWLSGALAGKPCAVFTSSSSMHGGQESTLLSMSLPLLHHGMLLVGVPYTETALLETKSGGTPYGASHIAKESNDTRLTSEESDIAQALGSRVAELALKINHSNQN
ncbi:MAG: NAD(P)H:quinone oxidoreductase [Pseudomonadota bacterium]|nr:NAD(P)H:quinone oxidoreductase [Pseudomonadota bacterium]